MSARPTISVIIPFYQRSAGILKKAVNSALAQENVPDFEIIVIDDESPVSAESELENVEAAARRKIRVIRQANHGPAGARNTGLDHLAADTTYVAFLDSDDVWSADHLSRGLRALQRGFDFYLSDMAEDGMPNWYQRPHCRLDGALSVVDAENDFLVHSGDVFGHFVSANFVCTPSVMFRRAGNEDIRFDENISVSEDRLFWAEILNRTNRVVFSGKCEGILGKGVNVFRSISYGTNREIRALSDQIYACEEMIRRCSMSVDSLQVIDVQIGALRRRIVLDVWHMLRRGRIPDFGILRAAVARDPGLMKSLIPTTFRIAASKVRRPRRDQAEGG